MTPDAPEPTAQPDPDEIPSTGMIEGPGFLQHFSEYEAIEARDRLWIKVIAPLLQAATADPDPNPRVQFALDRMRIAACERIARILSSDLADLSA